MHEYVYIAMESYWNCLSVLMCLQCLLVMFINIGGFLIQNPAGNVSPRGGSYAVGVAWADFMRETLQPERENEPVVDAKVYTRTHCTRAHISARSVSKRRVRAVGRINAESLCRIHARDFAASARE